MVSLGKAIENVENLPIQLKPLKFDYAKAFKDALREAVERDVSCMSEVNIALSGLDSSMLLALVNEMMISKPIHTYTIADGENHPDVIYSRKCSEIMGVKHEILVPKKSHVSQIFRKISYTFRDKIRYILLKTLYSQGVRELMLGDGGDELMMGYRGFEEYSKIRELYERYFPRHLREAFEKLMEINWKGSHFIYPIIYYWIDLKRDLIEMKYMAEDIGIQLFLPYLDEKVIRVVSRIPPSLKLHKALLKELLSTYYPQKLLSREKKGLCDAFRYLRVKPNKNINTIVSRYKK